MPVRPANPDALSYNASGASAGMGDDNDLTALYIIPELPEGIGEDELKAYFGVLGEIEEVSMNELGEGKRQGSVKFSAPTAELREMMLDEAHEIGGKPITIMTWKMQKLQNTVAGKGRATSSSAAAAGKGDPWDAWAWGKGGYGPMWDCDPWGYYKGGPYGMGYEDWFWQKGMYGKGAYMGKDPYWGGCAWGKDAWGPYGGGCKGAGKGAGRGKGWNNDETEVTACFLLSDLPLDITEDDLRQYFGALANIERVKVKLLGRGPDGNPARCEGSVKFLDPTMDLRHKMLKEAHALKGQVIKVQTHKMVKLAKSGSSGTAYAATVTTAEKPLIP